MTIATDRRQLHRPPTSRDRSLRVAVGASHCRSFTVARERCISNLVVGLPSILGTYALVEWMEIAAYLCIAECLDPGQLSVADSIDVQHFRAVGEGADVVIDAVVRQVRGHRVWFDVRAHVDGLEVIYEAFRDDLARPLQLEDFDFTRHRKSSDRSKSSHLAYPFYLSTRDMARIGQLVLEGGRWNGRVLVPEDWVAQVTRGAHPLGRDAAAPGRGARLFLWPDVVGAGRAGRFAARRRRHGLGRARPVHPGAAAAGHGHRPQAPGARWGPLERQLGGAAAVPARGKAAGAGRCDGPLAPVSR